MSSSHGVVDIHNLGEIIRDFDGFIVDQYGVLHDGQTPYPEAVQTLRKLMSSGKRVIILSNSGKQSDINIQRMSTLGFNRELYSEFVTSGDVASHKIKSLFSDKQQCLLISRDRDVSAIAGLHLKPTSNAETADLVIISASEADKYSEQHYIDQLHPAAQRQLPCLCTNPDKLMLTPGGIRFGAGRIAELYENLGGEVQWIGKPYKDVYAHAMQHLSGIPNERILCIGDSLEHDIAGGMGAGLKTLFIRGGIHQNMNTQELQAAIKLYKARPDYQLPYFQ